MESPNLRLEETARTVGALRGVFFTDLLAHAQRQVPRLIKAGAKPCWSAAGQVGAQRKKNVTGGERPAGEIRSRHRRSKCAVICFALFFCPLLHVWLVGPPLQVPRVPEVSYPTRSLRSSREGSVFPRRMRKLSHALHSHSPIAPLSE